MSKVASTLGQGVLYLLFAAFIGAFSMRPAYHPLPEGHALLKLSMSHAGALKSDCRKRSAEELAKLSPNMRVGIECPRERSPLDIALWLDGRLIHAETAQPSGLSRDGAATVYRRLVVPAGAHHLVVRMKDDARHPDAAHHYDGTLTLSPGQVVVIDFDSERKEVVVS